MLGWHSGVTKVGVAQQCCITVTHKRFHLVRVSYSYCVIFALLDGVFLSRNKRITYLLTYLLIYPVRSLMVSPFLPQKSVDLF